MSKVPAQFEYIHSSWPTRGNPRERHFVTILEEFEQHYTGEKVYRLRKESNRGYVVEGYYLDYAVQEMLMMRTDGD